MQTRLAADTASSSLFVTNVNQSPIHCSQPEYAKASLELAEFAHLKLVKVDATANNELAREFEIKSYPTLVFFTDGR